MVVSSYFANILPKSSIKPSSINHYKLAVDRVGSIGLKLSGKKLESLFTSFLHGVGVLVGIVVLEELSSEIIGR